MRSTMHWAHLLIISAAFVGVLGCEEEKKPAAPAKSANVPKAVASTPSIPTPAPEPPAPPKLREDCPKGSSGEGTFDKPCEAIGKDRMMDVTWTGKMDDKGPSFKVVNNSDKVILFGKIAVYFYDKAGKQLEIPDKNNEGKTKPYHSCSGNMFGGVMKPKEKATITFSCVKKAIVPEAATAIEAEMQMVGFADAEEKRVDFYWRNTELTPDERKKGGKKK